MKSKLARFGLVGVLCLPGVLFLTPAWGAATASCDVFSYTPDYFDSHNVGGTGGRSNCISTVSVQTDLRYDRFGPDPTVASRSGQVTNVTWTPYGCASSNSYYTNTASSSGQNSGSLNRTLSCS